MSEKFTLSPKQQALVDRIRPLQRINANGQFDTEKNVYGEIVKQDGLDIEQANFWSGHRSDFIAANHAAGGLNAIDFMVANPLIGSVSGTFEMGRDRMEVVYERHTRVPNRVPDKETGGFKVDGERDVYGASDVKFVVKGAKNSRGDLKAARDFVSEYARTKFST